MYGLKSYYSNKVIDGQMCIWLQGVGFVASKPAKDFSIGEKMMWNYGGHSTVTKILNESPSFITFQIEEDGKLYERKLKKDRYVATCK